VGSPGGLSMVGFYPGGGKPDSAHRTGDGATRDGVWRGVSTALFAVSKQSVLLIKFC
jgi:hypothetical protein